MLTASVLQEEFIKAYRNLFGNTNSQIHIENLVVLGGIDQASYAPTLKSIYKRASQKVIFV